MFNGSVAFRTHPGAEAGASVHPHFHMTLQKTTETGARGGDSPFYTIFRYFHHNKIPNKNILNKIVSGTFGGGKGATSGE